MLTGIRYAVEKTCSEDTEFWVWKVGVRGRKSSVAGDPEITVLYKKRIASRKIFFIGRSSMGFKNHNT